MATTTRRVRVTDLANPLDRLIRRLENAHAGHAVKAKSLEDERAHLLRLAAGDQRHRAGYLRGQAARKAELAAEQRRFADQVLDELALVR